MTTTVLAIIAISIWILGYLLVSGHLQKVYFQYVPSRKVPAIEFRDDIDYYPANPTILFGDHWAAVAGGAPLTGGATGAMWGWLPAFLYITVGAALLGGPHDYSTMHLSVRNKGKSSGYMISDLITKRAGKMGVFISWVTTAAYMAVFLSTLSTLFISAPHLTIPTFTFTLLGLVMGVMIYRMGWPVARATVVSVVIELISIYLGLRFPITLPFEVWFVIFTIYPIISASIPAWILVEPKNYISFIFLVIGCSALLIGCILGGLPLQLPPIVLNSAKGPLWPMLFLTISCGALTGAHATTTTTYTSRRVSNEKYVRVIGFGGLLLEGMTAFVSLASASVLTVASFNEKITGGWIFILQSGYAEIAGKVFKFIPIEAWQAWAGLIGATFMITTLEASCRLMRIYSLEFVEMIGKKKIAQKNVNVANLVASTVAMIICFVLAKSGAWFYIWVLFPALSSLLAAMSFMMVIMWLKRVGRPTGYFWFTLLFTIIIIAIPGASYLSYTYIVKGMYHLAWIPLIAIIMTVFYFYDFIKAYKGLTKEQIEMESAAENFNA